MSHKIMTDILPECSVSIAHAITVQEHSCC